MRVRGFVLVNLSAVVAGSILPQYNILACCPMPERRHVTSPAVATVHLMTATADMIEWKEAPVLLVLAIQSRTHQEHMQDKTR